MKIKCEKSLLQNSLTVAARAVSARSTMPVLEGILLSADDRVSITGYNLETGIVSGLNADILEKGDIVIPSRMLVDIVRKLPDDEVIISADSDHLVTIRCANAEFKIMGLPAEQFPKLPEINEESSIVMNHAMLKSMLSRTLFAVSINENKVIHTGALFELCGDTLSIVALDGFRLSIRREHVESPMDIVKFVAPGQALREVEHILDDTDEKTVRIIAGGKHIVFEIEDITVISRLLEGEFLDYKKAIPASHPIEISVSTKNLLECVERVSLLVNDKIKNPVRVMCDAGELKLSLHTPLGSATDRCMCDGDGENLEIGFNHRYLIDALKAALPDEIVKIKLGSSLSPCIIEPEEGDSYLFMVLPVRLKNE